MSYTVIEPSSIPLSKWYEDHKSRLSVCHSCSLRVGCKAPVPGSGALDSTAILFGEAPGAEEDKSGRCFTGKAGRELDYHYLRHVGVLRGNVYVSNVNKCRPEENETPTDVQIEACSHFMFEEIVAINPSVVGLMGATAVRAVFGPGYDLETYHGIPIIKGARVYLPMYHPAAGLHNPRLMHQTLGDFRVFADLYRTPPHSAPLRAKEHIPVDRFPNPKYTELRDDDPDSWSEVSRIDHHTNIAMDTETLPGANGELTHTPWCMTFAVEPGTAYFVDRDQFGLLSYLSDFVCRPNVRSILHNAAFDIPVLKNLGIEPRHYVDSMVAAYLLQDEPQGLKPLAYRVAGMAMMDYSDVVKPYRESKLLEYFGRAMAIKWPKPKKVLERCSFDQIQKAGELWRYKQPQGINARIKRIFTDIGKGNEVDFWGRWLNIDKPSRSMVGEKLGVLLPENLSDVPRQEAVHYAARDSDATLRVWPHLEGRIKSMGLESVLDTDIGVLAMVIDMERYGMTIDPSHFSRLSVEYYAKMGGRIRAIKDITGQVINPASSQQVGNLLFNRLGIKVRGGRRALTKGGNKSTKDEVLEGIRNQHPVIGEIIEWRRLQKNKESFADKIPEFADESNAVHPDIKTTRVVTGRLACSDPNLMAMPTRTDEGKRIRQGFIAKPGCIFISGDYSQIEMRVTAHESQDPELIRIYRLGLDVHNRTASMIFGIPEDQLDKMKHRYPTKRINFGILNGLTADGLHEQLVLAGCDGWNLAGCQELIDKWFSIYGAVKVRFQQKIEEARRDGFVRDMFGRIRLIPEFKSPDDRIQRSGERAACSAFIQSGAQGIIKKGMNDLVPLYRSYISAGYVCEPKIQIHDDLVFEVSESIADEFSKSYKAIMENAVALSVPLQVSLAKGYTWGDTHDIE